MNKPGGPGVFDIHIHVGEPDQTPTEIKAFQEALNPRFRPDDPRNFQPDQLADYLVSQGVRRAVILASSNPPQPGVPNEWVAAFAARRPDIFVPFASVHPLREPEAAAALERAVRELGCRGLKLAPVDQHFDPADRLAYPVYEVASGLKIPILTHTGTSMFQNARVRFASPLLWDDVAVDFPDLKIVLAHAGMGLFYDEAQWMCRRHPNVLIDISALPPAHLPRLLPRLESLALDGKALFGSDWPTVPRDIGENISAVRALPFSARAIDALLWENACNLLGLAG